MNRLFQLFCMLTLFLTSRAEAQKPAAQVWLVDKISARAPYVELGEIAKIESDDEELFQKLSALVVGKTPSVDQKRLVSSYRIRTKIQELNLSGEIEVHGLQTTVSTDSVTLGSAELKLHIEQWAMTLANDEEEVEVNFIRLPSSWKIPRAKGVRFDVQSSNRKGMGRLRLKVKAIADQRLLSMTHALVNIKRFREVVVMTRPIKKGEKFSPGHLEVRRADITKSAGMEIAQIKSALGMESKKNLPVGDVLRVDFIEQPILIRRGTYSNIIIMNGEIQMQLRGARALENGKKGDQILFSNPIEKKKKLRAEVIKSGVAIIRMK